MDTNSSGSQATILAVIAGLIEKKAPLQFSWQYQGVILSRDFRPLAVGENSADFQSSCRVLGTLPTTGIFLDAPEFSQRVNSNLSSMDIAQGRVTLTDFEYMDACWQERQAGRVRPKKPTYVTLSGSGVTLRALIGDISTAGMAVLGYKLNPGDRLLQPGTSVHFDFKLPARDQRIQMKGMVVYSQPASPELMRIGLQFFATPESLLLLKNYITRRKEEILTEGRHSYEGVFSNFRVAELFF